MPQRSFMKGRTSFQIPEVNELYTFPVHEQSATHVAFATPSIEGCAYGNAPLPLHQNNQTMILDSAGRSTYGGEFVVLEFDRQRCASAAFLAQATHQCAQRNLNAAMLKMFPAYITCLTNAPMRLPSAELRVQSPAQNQKRTLILQGVGNSKTQNWFRVQGGELLSIKLNLTNLLL